MAKKSTDVEKVVSSTDLKKAIKEINRQKKNAAEMASSAGGYVRGQIEKLNLEKTAFNWVLKLEGMEPQRKHEVLRCFLEYAFKAGVFDQVDMFDDSLKTLEAIVKDVSKNKTRTSSGGVLEEMVSH